MGIDRIARGTRNFRHNITVFSYKSIDNRRLSGIRTSYHSKARYIIIQNFRGFLLELAQHQVQQTACPTFFHLKAETQ